MSDSIRDALAELERERSEKLARSRYLYERAVAAHPDELSGLEQTIARRARSLHAEAMEKKLSANDTRALIDGGIAAVRHEYSERFKALGLDPDMYAPKWNCDLCLDTGYVTSEDGSSRPCECLRRRALQLASVSEWMRQDPSHTFESFSLDIFSNEELKDSALSQRGLMEKVLGYAIAYAAGESERPGLLISGKSGLGKTYLLDCIANRAAYLGQSVVMTTSYNLISHMKNAYLSRDGGAGSAELERTFFDADLVLLDDLGSEPMIPNITKEALFHIVNERCSARKRTAIATNLTNTQIREHYGERFSSRVIGEAGRSILLRGRDVRLAGSRIQKTDSSDKRSE